MWFGIWATLILLFVLSLIWHGFSLARKGYKTFVAVGTNLSKMGESFGNPDHARTVTAAFAPPRPVDVFAGSERKVLLREQIKASRRARKLRQQVRHEQIYAQWRAFNR